MSSIPRSSTIQAAARALVALPWLAAAAAGFSGAGLRAQETSSERTRVSEVKFALTSVAESPQLAAPATCAARVAEGSPELALFCRHELGSVGEVMLVRRGAGARAEPPFWSAPLASPFEATTVLTEDALDALLAGELVLRVETGASGVVAEGGIGTPIFGDGFDYPLGICRWSNFLCPDDNNTCTSTTCSSTGVCGTEFNTESCPLPNASGGCFLGGCIIQSCNPGASNCNVINTDGCEVNHNNGPGSCNDIADFVGAQAGDVVCGVICQDNLDDPITFATRTGRGEAYFEAEAQEQSTCDGSLEHRLDLVVPPGVDYDLYVYRDCQLVASGTQGTGVQEVVFVRDPEDLILSDDFFYQVEVRWFSGRSCEEWTLSFTGYDCD